MKQGIIAALVVVAIIAGAVVLGGEDTVTANPSNHFYGQEQGVITLTAYEDFECPACGSFAPIVAAVKEQYKDRIRFEFVNFPLVQVHQNAIAAHRAAEAAHNQGKFWEMHDLLFERQNSWRGGVSTNPVGVFEQYAVELGLDLSTFQADVAKSETLAIINADIAKGKELGVSATPTFYIDGVKIEDQASLGSIEGFSKAIQDAIDAKTGSATPAPSAE